MKGDERPRPEERARRAVRDPARLAELRATGMLDTGRDEGLDRLTRLASALLGVPVSLVSLVDDERQFFKSQLGLAEPWAAARETPLSHSFCQHVVASGDPLVVTDAREHDLLFDSPAIEELGVVAYLGVPLRSSGGQILGSFCAIDSAPREWSASDVATVGELATAAATEIDLRERLARGEDIDRLTGLVTRERLLGEIDVALRTRSDHGGHMALLVAELCRLELVNESLGRRGGDMLIAGIGSRLHNLRQTVVVGRVDGHRFGVLCPRVRDEHQALEVADELRALLREPFLVDGLSVYAELAIGIAIPDESDGAEDLLDGAIIAGQQARFAPGTVGRLLDASFRKRARRRLHIETELRVALERGELDVHYQPRVRLGDRAIVGYEALARWQHAELGWIPPSEFIPVAEESGLIALLGEAVLEAAVREAVHWPQRETPPAPFVSVNLSGIQLTGTDVPQLVRNVLAGSGLPAERLTLEITEAGLLEHTHTDALHDLVALGVRLDVDDFGTGYSSLKYIAEFPLSGLKIDRSFVSGLHEPRRESIVRAIIAMAAALEIDVTAEGIESEEQHQRLIELGARFGQGYLFGRPAPAPHARATLRRSAAAR